MTTSVFIRNDSPPGSGHDVFVGAQALGADGQPSGDVYARAAAPLKPGETVITTVWSGERLVISEAAAT